VKDKIDEVIQAKYALARKIGNLVSAEFEKFKLETGVMNAHIYIRTEQIHEMGKENPETIVSGCSIDITL